MSKKWLAASVSALLVLSACSGKNSAGKSGEDPKSGLITTATIDPESSRVELPANKYFANGWEQDEIFFTGSLAFSVCAKEKFGITYYAQPNFEKPPSEMLMLKELGPWTQQVADQFGFVEPAPRNFLSANGIVPKPKNIAQINAERKKYEEVPSNFDEIADACRDDPKADYFTLPQPGPWADDVSHSLEQTLADERVKKVIEELKTCYTDSGLAVLPTAKDSGASDGKLPITIQGADPMKINEKQIEIANKVVQCKTKNNAIKRITDVWAEKQAPIIEKYAGEMVAYRKKVDDLLKEAKEYQNQHKDLIAPPTNYVW
ncbi:hypothetical protein [Arcanobacterium canis]